MADTQVERNDQAMDAMAEEGRVTDTVMGHLTNGEIVIPLQIATNERAFEQLAMMFELSGQDVREFIVGHKENKINPDTGHPEFWGGFVGKVWNAVTEPVKTEVKVIKDLTSSGVNVAKDVIGGSVDVVKDLAKGDLGAAISDTGSTISNSFSDAGKGVTQAAKDAYTGTVKSVANIMDVVGLLPHAPAVQQGQASPSTITQGDQQNQRQQAVTDVQAAAGGGASSLTPRTVAGPDNDYKLNKSAVLGL